MFRTVLHGKPACHKPARRSVVVLSSSGQASSADPKPFDLKVQGRNPTDVIAWAEIVNTLKTANVTMVAPQEIKFMQEKGMVVLDIRPKSEFMEGFIEGAVNVPLYQPIDGWDPYKVVRRLGFAVFGVANATEPNPNFLQEVEDYVDQDAGVVLVCNLGGSLEPVPGQSSVGIQSRSLIAAHELLKAGYTDIKVLRGGMNGWKNDGRDLYVLDNGSADEN